MTYVKQEGVQDKANSAIKKDIEALRVKSKEAREDIESIKESIATLDSYTKITNRLDTEFNNTYNWDDGLVWEISHEFRIVPSLVQVWAKIGSYWMLIASQVGDVDSSLYSIYHLSLVVSDTKIRLESSRDNDGEYFKVGGDEKQSDDITKYRVVAITF